MATLLQPPWEVRAEQDCGVKPAAPLWPPGSGEQNTKLSIPEDLFWTPAESPGSPTHGHTSFRSRPAAPGGWRDPVSAAPPATGHTDPAAPGGWRMRPCVRSLRLPPLQGTQTRDLGQPVLSESPPTCSGRADERRAMGENVQETHSHRRGGVFPQAVGDAAGTDPRPPHELGYDGVLSGPCRVCEAMQKRAQHRSGTEGVRAEKHLCGVAQGFTSS
nr:uncharacterized protein LOC105470846 [Macaca nemestrina]